MIQTVVTRNPVGEIDILVNGKSYLIKVVAGGNRWRSTTNVRMKPDRLFAMLVNENLDGQVLVLPYTGEPDDVKTFEFKIDDAIIEVVCDVDMSVTVKSK